MGSTIRHISVQFVGCLFAFILFSSCFKLNSPVPHGYSVLLDIRDASNREILKEIPTVNNESYHENGWIGEVEHSLYDLKVVSKLCHKFKGDFIERKSTSWVIKTTNYNYLKLSTTTTGSCPSVNEITFKLRCPYIFGDYDEHVITTYWEPIDNKKYKEEVCSRFELDGKEFSVTEEPWAFSFGHRVAWIVLDN